MAASSTDPTQQLNDYIKTMHDQGILDDNFDQLLALRREQNPRFINELISMFTNDAEAYIAEITNAIGGHRMYQACCECDELFLRVKEEFNTLKQCLDSISQSLTEVDFSTIISKLHQLKGSTSG
ncbi:hypothetical protein GOBAR_AA31267 [Gossypium barbadense]|uniref:Histidine-containing phosphotransfer protein n=1 Tax=Gossypium barbadense TaxID=3634 RepID=A0A2P5WEA1_GOSBA|nr:hypothetical protein GOBAR_AA31267 [Gossypium barbadense]